MSTSQGLNNAATAATSSSAGTATTVATSSPSELTNGGSTTAVTSSSGECKRLFITHVDSFGPYLKISGHLNPDAMTIVRNTVCTNIQIYISIRWYYISVEIWQNTDSNTLRHYDFIHFLREILIGLMFSIAIDLVNHFVYLCNNLRKFNTLNSLHLWKVYLSKRTLYRRESRYVHILILNRLSYTFSFSAIFKVLQN